MKQKKEKKDNGVVRNIVTKQQVGISSTFVHFNDPLYHSKFKTFVNQRSIQILAARLTE